MRYFPPVEYCCEDLELLYIHSGQCSRRCGGRESTLRAGDFCLLEYNTPHRIINNRDDCIIIRITDSTSRRFPMMKFVSKTTEPFGVKTIVSLNPIMVDGTGMCGGCRVTVGGETKFACVDGPDFDGHQVDYAELMSRNSVYRDREAQVSKEHVCRMEAMGKALI